MSMLIGAIVSERPERIERLLDDLDIQGLRNMVMFFPAIYDRKSIRKGINLAHKQVIEYAKEGGFDEVCVMEDDVFFTHPNSFNYFLQQKPIDFDIFLSSVYIGEVKDDHTVNSFSGFGCYIVHSRFYDTYLSVPDDCHIDRAMEGLGKFVVCPKFCVIQYNGFSHNTGKDENYDTLLSDREMYKG